MSELEKHMENILEINRVIERAESNLEALRRDRKVLYEMIEGVLELHKQGKTRKSKQ